MDNKEKNNEEKLEKGEIIGSILVLVYIFGSLFAIGMLGSIKWQYGSMILGQLLLVPGILLLAGKQIVGAVFTLIGLSCVIIPWLMLKPTINGYVIDWEAVCALLFIGGFILFGLGLIVVSIIKIKKYNKKVEATIIKYLAVYYDDASVKEIDDFIYEENSTTQDCSYYPIYEFYLNNEKYNVRGMGKNSINKPIGSLVNIKINSRNPQEYITFNTMPLIPILIGIVFLIMAIPCFILMIQYGDFIKK